MILAWGMLFLFILATFFLNTPQVTPLHQDEAPLRLSSRPFPLPGFAHVLHDPTGTLSIADVRGFDSQKFTPLNGDLAEGYHPNSAYWLRFTVRRDEGRDGDWWLEVGMPYLDQVDLYSPDGQGGYQVTRQGDLLPPTARMLPTRNFTFMLPLPDQTPRIFYLRTTSLSALVIKARIWHLHGLLIHGIWDALFLGVVHGALLVTLLFALVQWFILRDRVFALFALLITVVEIHYLGLNGFLPLMGVPPVLADIVPGMFTGLTGTTGSILFYQVLNVRERLPTLRPLFPVCAVIAAIAAFSVPFGGMKYGAGPVMHASILGALVLSFIAILLALAKGERIAYYLLVAFLVSMTGANIQVLRNLGVIVDYGNIEAITQAGLPAMMVLVAAGLAHRYRDIQASLFRITHQREVDLAERVEERTRELTAAYRKAEHALEVERIARNEQRNLLSMVTHEFRTPLSVIDTVAQMLRMEVRSPDETREIEKILRSTRRMTHLMDGCLNDERFESTMIVSQGLV